MATAFKPSSPRPARSTQARGRERRAALLQAARRMLLTQPLESLGLGSVAEEAGIPPSSAYHLFNDMAELLGELARELAIEFVGEVDAIPPAHDWRELVEMYLAACRESFNADGALRQLMVGRSTSPSIKHAACREDYRFGRALLQTAQRRFGWPDSPSLIRPFYTSIIIADALFSLSVAEQDQVTPEALREAQLAAIAYLNLFLPDPAVASGAAVTVTQSIRP